jgi:hypothetical protein
VVHPRPLEALPGHIPARQRHRQPLVGADRERAARGVQGGDLATGPVDHPQPRSGVAATDHLVAHPELLLADLEGVGSEPAGLCHELPRGGVEPGCFGAGEGDHAGLLAVAEALPPVADLGGVGFRFRAAHHHLAVRHQPL